MSHFKHLVLEDRITIQSDLHDGLSFKKIASHINHDCTTVSSEIRNHLTVVDDMWPTNRKHGSLTLAHSQNSQMSFMYGFFFVKFLFFTVVCVVIVI